MPTVRQTIKSNGDAPINNFAGGLLEPEIVDIDSLIEDPDNARLHPERNIEAVMESVRRHGQRSTVIVRRENRVVAKGNGTMAALKRLGWTQIAASFQEMTDAEFHDYALADNRSGELAQWDYEIVARLQRLHADTGHGKIGWSDDELFELRKAELVQNSDPDQAPELPVNSVSQIGDIWVLGEHRLMCGDSTDERSVAALLDGEAPFIMVTDPPYGVAYDAEWRLPFNWSSNPKDNSVGKISGDVRIDWSEAYKLFPGSVVYCWHADRHASTVQASLEAAGFEIRCQIIWVKQHFVFGRGHYHRMHEPLWMAVRQGSSANWTGDRKQTTVWEIQNHNPMGGNAEEGLKSHSAQKPIECMARPIRNHGNVGDIVYDPFVGSGTTIIAAHQLGRRCFAMDIDPTYVDLSLQRWLDFTGIDPIREADGMSFSSLK